MKKFYMETFLQPEEGTEEKIVDTTMMDTFVKINGRIRLSPVRWDQSGWIHCDNNGKETSSESKEISLLTWNVWFSYQHWRLRCQNVLEIIEKHSPDIVCLQEIIPEFMQEVLNNKYVQQTYYLSDRTTTSVKPHGVLIMSKIPVEEFNLYGIKPICTNTAWKLQ